MTMLVKLTVETDREEDGRWIAEVLEIPGALAYGATLDDAVHETKALALAVLADRAHREDIDRVEFASACLCPRLQRAWVCRLYARLAYGEPASEQSSDLRLTSP
jgi:predicted RNase H-like HicB family nuclease